MARQPAGFLQEASHQIAAGGSAGKWPLPSRGPSALPAPHRSPAGWGEAAASVPLLSSGEGAAGTGPARRRLLPRRAAPGVPGQGGSVAGPLPRLLRVCRPPLPGGGHPPGLGVSPRSTPRGPSGDKAGGRVPLNRSSLRWPPAYSGGGGSPVGCKPRVSKPRTSVCLCPTTALLVQFLVSPK